MSATVYQQAIKALAEAAHGSGRLEDPDGISRLDNPLCGDRIDLTVRLAGEVIAAVGHETRACLLCRAAASLVGLTAPGRSPAEMADATTALEAMLRAAAVPPPAWKALEVFAPVAGYPSRHGCVLLPFQALKAALAKVANTPTAPQAPMTGMTPTL